MGNTCCCEPHESHLLEELPSSQHYDASLVATTSMGERSEEWTEGDVAESVLRQYTEWDSIVRALHGADIVLIRGSFVEAVHRKGGVLPRRQDLPTDAIWDADELFRDVQDYGKPTPQILAISYSWLSRDHPDPDGYHLQVFAPLLRHFATWCKVCTENLALFIDWCSLPQNPRSHEEMATFNR